MGKTTLLKNCLRSDVCVLVGYGGSSAVVGEEISALDDVLREVGSVLKRGGVAVVDEFQRLLTETYRRAILLVAGATGRVPTWPAPWDLGAGWRRPSILSEPAEMGVLRAIPTLGRSATTQ